MKRWRADKGLSLLEVLVALAIMALVIGVAAPRAIGYFERAKSKTADLQLNAIKAAVQLFYVDVGRYPTEAEGLVALVTSPPGVASWRGPYIDDPEALSDPWGRPYRYRQPGEVRDFDVMSLGRDGQPGGSNEDADISL